MVQPRGAEPVPAAKVLVVGPGLVREADRAGLAELWLEDRRAAVWDASALAEIGARSAMPRVITPHPAEAARLLSARTGETWTAARVQADRPLAARSLATVTGAVVVLKGEGTLVAEGSRLGVCVSGGPALATAGSGDCLAGAIAALLGRGLSPWAAATAGVHVHGVAGERLVVGAVALDIADAIAAVLAAPEETHPRFRGACSAERELGGSHCGRRGRCCFEVAGRSAGSRSRSASRCGLRWREGRSPESRGRCAGGCSRGGTCGTFPACSSERARGNRVGEGVVPWPCEQFRRGCARRCSWDSVLAGRGCRRRPRRSRAPRGRPPRR
ncbi:ADP-dependent NAD(P)H-hydrate dehydratase [Nannocystis pusilla]|uniref:ADP-dependent NAD(P)H-hydrate dehydratase n=1 Tax=Nannocystis pusilla TaxID=889268 RepID=UPI003B834C6B